MKINNKKCRLFVSGRRPVGASTPTYTRREARVERGFYTLGKRVRRGDCASACIRGPRRPAGVSTAPEGHSFERARVGIRSRRRAPPAGPQPRGCSSSAQKQGSDDEDPLMRSFTRGDSTRAGVPRLPPRRERERARLVRASTPPVPGRLLGGGGFHHAVRFLRRGAHFPRPLGAGRA